MSDRGMEAAWRVPFDEAQDIKLRELIDEQYTKPPFYDSRPMVVSLRKSGHVVNRWPVTRPNFG